jgi:hypothetical protein
LEVQAADLAVEDALYALDKALAGAGAGLSADEYLKQVGAELTGHRLCRAGSRMAERGAGGVVWPLLTNAAPVW